MEKANQLFYLILGVFIFSFSINAYLELKKIKYSNNANYYWISALTLLTTSCISFALAPVIHYFFLTIANTLNLTATICIALLFRSWNSDENHNQVSKKTTYYIIFIAILYATFFELLRIQDNFLARTYLVIITLGLTLSYQLKQTYFLIKKQKSIHLKFIFLIIATQVFILLIRLTSPPNELSSQVTNIYQENEQGLAIRMVWYSSFLLLFMFIANYNYEQLLINQRKITDQLKKKKERLTQKTKENRTIKNLLNEREKLINSLIVANKTATTGALSASIAHELNQPLSAMRLNTDYLKIQINSNNLDYPSLEETINDINSDNQRAAKIISSLKSIFQQLTVQTTPTDLNSLIESLLPIFSTTAKNNNIQLKLELNAISKIMLNESEFQQVILNLINNAIEALVDQPLTEKTITIRTTETDRYQSLSIIDNGSGVPKKNEERLFTLMNTSKQSGTGLGLWLSKCIVERHNGQINYLHSQPNRVEFLIKLPLI